VFVIPLVDWDVESKNPQLAPIGGERDEEQVSLSNYDLSCISACSRVCFAFEEMWKVL
jgi:hypothetical protein